MTEITKGNLPGWAILDLLHEKGYKLIERVTHIILEHEISELYFSELDMSLELFAYGSKSTESFHDIAESTYVLINQRNHDEFEFSVLDVDELVSKILEIINEEV